MVGMSLTTYYVLSPAEFVDILDDLLACQHGVVSI